LVEVDELVKKGMEYVLSHQEEVKRFIAGLLEKKPRIEEVKETVSVKGDAVSGFLVGLGAGLILWGAGRWFERKRSS